MAVAIAPMAVAIREPVSNASNSTGSSSTTAPASGQQAPQPTYHQGDSETSPGYKEQDDDEFTHGRSAGPWWLALRAMIFNQLYYC